MKYKAREKARINPVVLDWNCRHQYELMVFNKYKDKYRNKFRSVCVCGLVDISTYILKLCPLRGTKSSDTPIAMSINATQTLVYNVII